MLAARCLMLNSYMIDRYFLRTLNGQCRRRQVVDRCNLLKERPQATAALLIRLADDI